MKKISWSVFFFILFLFLIILIDLPENFPLKVSKNFKLKLGLDLRGGSHLVFEANMKDINRADRPDALIAARNIIERRVNFFGVAEPNVQTLKTGGRDRIVVELPGIDNVSDAINLIGSTSRLEFKEESKNAPPIATSSPPFLRLTKTTGLTGKHVKKSAVQFDSQGKPSVSLDFDSQGARLFEEITKRNVGKPLGIFIDNIPISTPIVNQTISGGNAIITGSFSLDEARELSIAINSGALPVPIKLIEERRIGSTLGDSEVRKSVFAGLVGLSSVILFMILYYRRLGVIASVALLIYGLINLAIFKVVPIILTLPGIAGFILSIGMAVDSNILIFERIKEEMRLGKKTEVAIRLGFGRALNAIKDANFTTLLVAFILFNPLNWDFLPQFGLVRGFALTLAIGVVTSLFTGVLITKRLIEIFYKPKK